MVACTSSSGPNGGGDNLDAGGPGPLIVPAEGYALRVDSSELLESLPAGAPPAGSIYLRATLTLASGLGAAPLPINITLFGLTVGRGLILSPALESSTCPTGASLAPGAMVQCTAVWLVQDGDTFQSVAYTPPGGMRILASFSSLPACPAGRHRCAGRCVSNDSVDTCGDRCARCPAGTGEAPTCNAGRCEIACAPGNLRCGDACVACPADSGAMSFRCEGSACVAAGCADGQRLMDGRCVATTWSSRSFPGGVATMDLAVATSGAVHLVYSASNSYPATEPTYYVRNGVRTSLMPMSGSVKAIAVDSAGTVHWLTTTAYFEGTGMPMPLVANGSRILVLTSGMAFDQDGTLHLLLYGNVSSGSGSTYFQRPAGGALPPAGRGLGGNLPENHQLVVHPEHGAVALARNSSQGYALTVYRWSGSAWTALRMLEADEEGAALGIEGGDLVMLRGRDTGLVLSRYSGGTWADTTLPFPATAGRTIRYTNAVTDGDGNLHAVVIGSDGTVGYVTSRGGWSLEWTRGTAGGAMRAQPRIGVDGAGNPTIAFVSPLDGVTILSRR